MSGVRTFLESQGFTADRTGEGSNADDPKASLMDLFIIAIGGTGDEPVHGGLITLAENLEAMWALHEGPHIGLVAIPETLLHMSKRLRVLAQLHERQLRAADRELDEMERERDKARAALAAIAGKGDAS